MKDPTVFAAASDVDATSIVDLFAVKNGYPTCCLDAVAAFSQAEEQELIFIEGAWMWSGSALKFARAGGTEHGVGKSTSWHASPMRLAPPASSRT